MTTYIVSYDVQTGMGYEALYEAIKSYPNWAKITESTWAVVTNRNAPDVRNHLMNFVGNSGRLIVIKSGVEAAWHNSICDNDWLKKNL